MAEIISPILKESNSRMVAIIGLFVIITGLLYFFFTIMLSCLAIKSTGQCLRQYWLFYAFTVVICALVYFPLMQLINQIVYNFKVKDDYMAQLRRKAELDNIKALKNMGYKVKESEFSDGIKKLIGIYKESEGKKLTWKFWKRKGNTKK